MQGEESTERERKKVRELEGVLSQMEDLLKMKNSD